MKYTADGALPNDYATGELFALDPSLNGPGAALFRGGKLVAAERVKVDKTWTKLDIGERASRVAEAVMRWGVGHNMEPRVLVYERPQVYTREKSDGDPNDLIAIALVAGEFGGMLRMAMAARNVSLVQFAPTPNDWTGNIPKAKKGDPWESARARRVRARLTDEEFAAVVPSHDAIDAVGIGLWRMGLLTPTRAYPRGDEVLTVQVPADAKLPTR